MKAWRAVVALSFLLLSGCLVTVSDPIPANVAAPIPLLGEWARTDDWGEELFLHISRSGSNVYQAETFVGDRENLDSRKVYSFTVAHHGRRWYLSAGLPRRLGANFAIAGFELTQGNELVLYSLDVERIMQEMEQGVLRGEAVETPQGQGALITSPLEQVLAYLDDPANSDVFVEVARYQRVGQ